MEVFQAQAIDKANHRMVDYAKNRFPDYFVSQPESDIEAFIATVRNQSKEYDVVNEDDVATALDLTVMYGPGFWSQTWAEDVIALTALNGAEKMEILRHRVREHNSTF